RRRAALAFSNAKGPRRRPARIRPGREDELRHVVAARPVRADCDRVAGPPPGAHDVAERVARGLRRTRLRGGGLVAVAGRRAGDEPRACPAVPAQPEDLDAVARGRADVDVELLAGRDRDLGGVALDRARAGPLPG